MYLDRPQVAITYVTYETYKFLKPPGTIVVVGFKKHDQFVYKYRF